MKIRFIVMLVALIVISVGWISGWFYLSGEAKTVFTETIRKASNGDRHFQCDNQRTSGFPFRLGVHCDAPTFIKGDNFMMQAAAMHAQAFVYKPLHQVVDFKSPARIKAGKLGTIEIIWQMARLGSQLQSNGLSAATARIKDVRANLVNAPVEFADTSLKADDVLLSARRTSGEEPPDSIMLGTVAKGISVLGSKYALPPVALSASVLAYDIAPVLSGKARPFPLWVQKGGEADIQHFNLISGNAELLLAGWIKLDQDGFANASLNVDSANLLEFVDQMGPELIQIQTIARAVIAAMEGLGKSVSLNGKPAKRVKVSIKRGFVKVGFIPLGTIPRLDLTGL